MPQVHINSWIERRAKAERKAQEFDRLKAENTRLREELALAETNARNFKTAMEANRDAAMGFQDNALTAQHQVKRLRAALEPLVKAARESLRPCTDDGEAYAVEANLREALRQVRGEL